MRNFGQIFTGREYAVGSAKRFEPISNPRPFLYDLGGLVDGFGEIVAT